jgi:formylmethanofuran dehydrogenase subunit B
METIRVVCAHDCPDMCSLLAEVDGGRVVRIKGDPDHSFTAGFACAKVNRDAELVHSPERLKTPLRRVGAKGEGKFAPITWDAALDEITERWRCIIAESGPQALLGYAYSAHQGLMNRGLPLGLFRALGASRLIAGTVCDTCCEEAWNVTCGPVGGADPESVDDSDLIVSWGADLVATNVHFWARVEAAKKRGVKLVVIDPRKSRTARQADWFLQIKIGTDAALALGIMHVLARDGLVDRDYVATHTLGFDRIEAEILPHFSPERVAEITGLQTIDIENFAALYGAAKKSFIRLGEGMTRLMRGGEALRAVALLPGVTGAYGRRGGGALLLTGAVYELDFDTIRNPTGAPADAARTVNHLRLGDALLNLKDPPIRALFIAANNPAVTNPDAGAVRQGLAREDLFTIVHDPFMTATARYADIVLPAATYLETEDLYRAYGAYYLQYAPAAAGRGALEFPPGAGIGDPHGVGPAGLPRTAGRGAGRVAARRQGRDSRDRPRAVAPGRPAEPGTARRPAVPHPVRQTRILFRAACRRRFGADARLAARPAGRTRRRALASAPVDRARLFSGAHRLCRGRVPAPARGRARLHPPSRRWLQGAALQRARRDRAGAPGQRRGAPGRRARPRSAARRRDNLRHGQYAGLRPLHRYRRRRDLSEHVSRHREMAGRSYISPLTVK